MKSMISNHRHTVAAVLFLATAATSGAAYAQLCEGYGAANAIKRLGGRGTAFSGGVYMDSIATLQENFTKNEADIRAALAQQGQSGLADALMATVASGENISTTIVSPGDTFDWMVWRRNGKVRVQSPICLATSQNYGSYEVVVPVDNGGLVMNHKFAIPRVCMNLAYMGAEEAPQMAEAVAVPPAPDATCAINTSIVQGKVGDTVSVWVDGTYSNIDVMVTDESGATVATLVPPFPQTFTLPAAGIFTIGGAAVNADGVEAECLAATVAADPNTRWTFRPLVAGINPAGEYKDVVSPGTDAAGNVIINEKTSNFFETGYGIGAGLEYHLNDKVGIEGRLILGAAEAHVMYDTAEVWEMDEDDIGFASATIGPNYHFTGKDKVDAFVGAFAGVAKFGDATLSTPAVQQEIDFDTEFVYGAQLGADIRLSETSPWKLHIGIMKMFMEAEEQNTGREVDMDPVIGVIGAARDF